MSRHRIVRAMNYEDEYYDEDDEYSRSVEDNYCISPGTAAQFTWNREKHLDISAYMGEENIIEEEEEDELDDGNAKRGSFSESGTGSRLLYSDEDQARLNSCLEEARNILGESVPESVMCKVIVQNNFDVEKSLNELLTAQDAPKPQREPRQRRNRTQASPANAAVPSNSSQVAAANTVNASVTDRLQPDPKTVIVNTVKPIAPSNANSAVVTPFKSAAKVTVGFEAPTPPASPSISKKNPNLKLKVQNSRVPSPSPNRDTKLKKNVKSSEHSDTSSGLDTSLRSAVEDMGLAGDKDVIQTTVDAMKPLQSTPKFKSKKSKMDVMAEYAKRHGDKELINLVVIGHVDAGKSTLMGHLLYQLGAVNKKTMHKYEQESKKLGKSSFAFAWVLDETEEERTRGVTMDVAQTKFETDKKVITLLDAPGHKDFIPNMITGAAQADVGILVINATRGEFETGFDAGGQTREHALLARSLGVGQIIVAVNKMDTVEWSEERYSLITKKIGQFLFKQAGFKDSDVTFIPCSGLSGDNLVKAATEPKLTSWYNPSVTLMEQIDKLHPPLRPIDKPFRMSVSDVFKGIGTGFNVSGRVGSGYVQPGDKVLILPAGVSATIKSVFIDDIPCSVAFAGDHVNVTMSGMDMANIHIGSGLCDPSAPSKSATRIRAKIVLFNMEVPITKGFPVVFHYQSINEPAVIKRLLCQLNRSTGEVIKRKPRCLVKNSSAIVEIELERSMCVELYSEYKDLGRFMLRNGGHTIAAGVVEEIVQEKASLNGAGPS